MDNDGADAESSGISFERDLRPIAAEADWRRRGGLAGVALNVVKVAHRNNSRLAARR